MRRLVELNREEGGNSLSLHPLNKKGQDSALSSRRYGEAPT